MYSDPTFPFFFFSSRRRHTRWPRDWSSDVCSSDLNGVDALAHAIFIGAMKNLQGINLAVVYMNQRSEERRVGKEGRARGAEEGADERDEDDRSVQRTQVEREDGGGRDQEGGAEHRV